MKTRVLIIIGLISIVLFVPSFSHGMWREQPLEELWKQSQTIFVGTITSVNILEFERSNTYNVEENGVSRIIIENYTQTLDEYTVSIEEFLKNPQESNTITMLEATVRGVPGRSVSIGGFELGDRVLFYVPQIDGTNQYSPESQIIRTDNELFYFQDEFKKFSSAENTQILSPLKQIKNGVALIDVICAEGKFPSYKYDRMRVACVSEETQNALWLRGWATMRLIIPGENISHALCNNYEGKWHPEYEGCRGNITDLQCSLMGGEFVDDLKICYDEICPVDKTYTLCVTNPDLISGELENEN